LLWWVPAIIIRINLSLEFNLVMILQRGNRYEKPKKMLAAAN